MLRSGAEKVWFAKVWDNQLLFVFNEIMKEVPDGTPVICESPALRNFVEPGLFVIITSETTNKLKDISNLKELPHVIIKFEDLKETKKLPFGFENGIWTEVGSLKTEANL